MSDLLNDDLTPEFNGDGHGLENHPESCNGRRRFLGQVAGAAGGLALGVSALSAGAAENNAGSNADNSADVVVKLNDEGHKGLSKVGGFEVIATGGGGKVIVAHPDEATYVACSAICTHRGGQLFYDPKTKQFACPLHGARFDLDGKVAKGPAKTPLQSYATDPAIIVEVKPVA